MAVTVDDLPSTGDLPPGMTRLQIAQAMLKAFKEEKMPLVYGMVNGAKTAEEPGTMEVLRAWRAAGEPLGSHTWAHLSLNDETAEQFEAEIAKDEPLLEELMGTADWHWFRYPFLWEGDTLEKRHAVRAYLQQHGYRVAQVTVDFEDYLWSAPYARCVAKQDAASIWALEESYLATADQFLMLYRAMALRLYGHEVPYVLLVHVGAFTAHMMPRLIELYRERGIVFVGLPAAEADPAYALDPDLALKYGGTLTEQLMEARKMPEPPSAKPIKWLESVCQAK